MKRIIKKLKANKKSVLIFCLVFVFLLNINPASAANITAIEGAAGSGLKTLGGAIGGTVGAAVTVVLGLISYVIVAVLGLLTTLLIQVLVNVAQFNHIIDVATVRNGWVIVRDICNMFFILILLVIAFGTILRQDNYSAKKLLPKLLVMAVVINFSKTIFGLLIDFSTVTMLTFVASFKNGGGHFVNVVNMQDWFALADSKGQTIAETAVTQWAIVTSIIASVIAAILTFVIMAVMLAVLVMRVVMLWIYTILSPLVFLGFAFPPIEKYTNQIWQDFIKQLVVGPMLAFFIWLALTTAQMSSEDLSKNATGNQNLATIDNKQLCANAGAFFCEGNFQKFIIVIGLLMGGLMVTQQMGGAISKAANFGDKWSKSGLNKLREGGDWAQRKFFNSERAQKMGLRGVDLSPTRQWDRIKEGFKQSKQDSINTLKMHAVETRRAGKWRGVLAAHNTDNFIKDDVTGFLGLPGILRLKRGGLEKEAHERKSAAEDRDEVAVLREIKQVLERNGGGHVDLNNNALRESIERGNEFNKLSAVRQTNILKNIAGKDAAGLDADMAAKLNSAKNHDALADKYKIYDSAGDKALMGLINGEKKDISTTDEDKIAEDFMAVSSLGKGKWKRAAALFLKATEEGGLNTLLGRAGYSSVDAGFTKEEAEKLKNGTDEEREHYMKRRGVNDFVRDYFIDKLGMDEQNAYALQAESANIAFSKRHLYGAKTIKTEYGKFDQRGASEQRQTILTEVKKGDSEGFVRNAQRASYGGFDADGKWTMSDTGKELLFNGWKGVMKEIKGARWNKSAAESISKNIASLRELFDEMVKESGSEQSVVDAFGEREGSNIKDFLVAAEEYGKKSGTAVADMISKSIEEKRKEAQNKQV